MRISDWSSDVCSSDLGIDKEFTGEAWPGDGITVGYLAQEPELDPTKTVQEPVLDGVRAVADMMARFNEIRTLMADPPADADFDALMEEMGTPQAKIDAVEDRTRTRLNSRH